MFVPDWPFQPCLNFGGIARASTVKHDGFVMYRFCSKLWLYYKPITIVNDDSSVVNKLETLLNDDA